MQIHFPTADIQFLKNRTSRPKMGREGVPAVPPKLAYQAHFEPTNIGFPDNVGITA
jgi:hypothetical protein